MIRVIVFTVIIFLFTEPALTGQGFSESSIPPDKPGKLKIVRNGYVRTSFFGGSRKYDFTTVFAEAGLKVNYASGNAFLSSDLRLRSGSQFNEEFLKAEIKELYTGLRSEKVDFFLGSQIVTWGRTDGFNPTNSITPVDYFFLSAEPDDQNLSNVLGRLIFRLSQKADLEIIGIPLYKPSVYRFNLFDLGENVAFSDPILPEKRLRNSTVAARLNVELPMAGFSFSWYRGFDPLRGFDIKNVQWPANVPEITYVLTPYLKNAMGADLTIPVGSWLVKGEGSFNLIRNPGSQLCIPSNNLQFVTAMEKTFSGIYTIVQYIGQAVPGFSALQVPVLINPSDPEALFQYSNDLVLYETAQFNRKIFHQQKKSNHAVSCSFSRQFAYETWKADLTAYYNFTSEEYFMRLALAWNIYDALSLRTGYSFMQGPDHSLFDYAGAVMNGAFFELKVTF